MGHWWGPPKSPCSSTGHCCQSLGRQQLYNCTDLDWRSVQFTTMSWLSQMFSAACLWPVRFQLLYNPCGFLYLRIGMRGRELMGGVGKTMMQSGGTFGTFMAIGMGIRCWSGAWDLSQCPHPAIPLLYNNKVFRYLEVRALNETVHSYPLCSADCKHAFDKISTFFPSLTPKAMRINNHFYYTKVPVLQI